MVEVEKKVTVFHTAKYIPTAIVIRYRQKTCNFVTQSLPKK